MRSALEELGVRASRRPATVAELGALVDDAFLLIETVGAHDPDTGDRLRALWCPLEMAYGEVLEAGGAERLASLGDEIDGAREALCRTATRLRR